jgi:hypothetical protein
LLRLGRSRRAAGPHPQGYRRFRCRDCGKEFNERSAGLLNWAQYPTDVIALVVLWRLRYRLTLRDLSKMFLQRGVVFSYQAVRDWEARLSPILAKELRQRRHGRGGTRSRHWHVDETYVKVRGRLPRQHAPRSVHPRHARTSTSGGTSPQRAVAATRLCGRVATSAVVPCAASPTGCSGSPASMLRRQVRFDLDHAKPAAA